MKRLDGASYIISIAVCAGLAVYFGVSGNLAALGMAAWSIICQIGWWMSDRLADDSIALLKEIARRLEEDETDD